jgi:DNA-binding transcriptional regulator YdaS (Cro superfamily)
MNSERKHIAFERACDIVGCQAKMARLLNMKPPTINQWIHLVKQIPAERCPEIEKLTNGTVKCEELRPDIDWAYLRSTVTTTQPQASTFPIPETELSSIPVEDSGKLLIIDKSDRRNEERRKGDRRDGDRRNDNGAGRRVGERRICDRRSCDRRE